MALSNIILKHIKSLALLRKSWFDKLDIQFSSTTKIFDETISF